MIRYYDKAAERMPAGLIAEAQMGTLEFSYPGKPVEELEKPDLMVFGITSSLKLRHFRK